MIAATVFGHCRANSPASSAPRQSVARAADAAGARRSTPKVLKKLSRFIPATVSEPPDVEGVAAGRALAGVKFGRRRRARRSAAAR